MLLHVWLAISATALAPHPPLRRTTRLHARRPQRRPRAVDYGDASLDDDLYFLRNAEDVETRQQMKYEASAAAAAASFLEPRREAVADFVAATAPPPPTPPPRWATFGGWEWRERVAGDRRVWERRRPGSDDVEVVLDEDAAPATLTSEFGGAEYRGFVRGISDAKISPDGERLAYTVDAAGDEKYVCEFLPEGATPVRDVDACVAWGGDGDLYALRTDATGRPHEVWRIKDGTESLVFREDDQRFRIEVISGETVLFLLRSRDAAEVRDAAGAVLVPRRQGVEVAACDLRDGVLWRVEDSALLRGEDAVAVPGAAALDAVVAAGVDRAVVGGVKDARGATWLVSGDDVTQIDPPAPYDDVELRTDVPVVEGLVALEISAPHRFARVLRYDVARNAWADVPPPPTPHESALAVERFEVEGIPVSLASSPKTNSAVAMYAYGAYGARLPRALDAERCALLEHGYAVASCGVRGGGERGAAWHAQGRRLDKDSSAADVVACASALEKRYGRVVARGRSAGGLSVGGAVCARPDLFAGVALDVPFLDPLGTLADATLPLTVNEWEEFGDPHEANAREAIAAYAPLQRAAGVESFPPCLLRPALRDARTGWWESFKFAAAVRDATGDAATVVVHADDRGHFGPAAGRARAYDVALPVAFLLACGEDALATAVDAVPADETSDATFTVDAAPDAALLTKAAELRTEVFSPHLTTVGSRYLQTRRYEDELKEAAGVAVAVSGGDVVGVASAAAVPADAWYVSAVATAPQWRRRGVASALLDALDGARGHNAALLHVVETNAAARALYERRGFEAIDEGSLAAACAAAVAREIEGSDEAQILMRLPGTGKKPKPAKKRKRSKGFSRKR